MNPITWIREGEWYYFSKVGVWHIELHKARKYWVANLKQKHKRKIIKKYMLTTVSEADQAKEWIEKEFQSFLDSTYCSSLMKDD